MNNLDRVFYIIATVAVIAITIVAIIRAFILNTTTYEEVVSTEDDPYLKTIAEFRANQLKQLLLMICNAWGAAFEDISFEQQQIDFDTQIVEIGYKSYLLLLKIHWNRGLMKCDLSYQDEQFRFDFDTKMKIDPKNYDLKRFGLWLEDCQDIIDRKQFENNEGYLTCLQAAFTVAEKFDDDKMFLTNFFDAINQFEIHNNKKERKRDMLLLTRLLSYALKHHKDEFCEYNGITNKDKKEDE